MKDFDFNKHFHKFKNNHFYTESGITKTYSDLLNDISTLSLTSFSSLNTIAIKIQSPYLAFVALLAGIKENKLIIIISHLESDLMIEKLRSQIHFDYILEDHHFQNRQDVFHSSFPFIDLLKSVLVIFSSGTTSIPKGIVLNFSNIFYSSKGFSQYFGQSENEKSLINLPHHHVSGLMTLWRAFLSGGSITTEQNSEINYISLIPMQLKRMIENQDSLKFLKSIRVILIGGSPLNEILKNEAKSHGLNIYETYGMTETTSLITINGNILPYREMTIDGDGHLNVKGKTLASGYFEKNKYIAIPPDWFKTKDLGRKDENGKFIFLQRMDLIFISGGENINPLLIEEVANQHSHINCSYLVPVKDEKWGEMGVMLYETHLNQNLSTLELNQLLKKNLHPHHIPKFYFKTEFKLSGQLKVNRNELKMMAQNFYLKEIFSFNYFEIKDAPVIIFFHGFMGDKEDLKNISQSISLNYSRLFIDLPGHGNSKIKNFHSTNDLFNKLSLFIKLFSSDPIFYGYSLGGRVALHLALNFIRPKILILESTGLGLQNSFDQEARKQNDCLQFDGIDEKNLPAFLNNWYDNPIFKNYKNHESYQLEIRKKSQYDHNEWRNSQKYLSSGCFPLIEENLEKISHIRFPLHYIYGELDLKYKSFGLKLDSLKPNLYITIQEVINSGHNPHLTHEKNIKEKLTTILK